MPERHAIARGWTTPDRNGLMMGSAGALIAANAIKEHPGLWAFADLAAGVYSPAERMNNYEMVGHASAPSVEAAWRHSIGFDAPLPRTGTTVCLSVGMRDVRILPDAVVRAYRAFDAAGEALLLRVPDAGHLSGTDDVPARAAALHTYLSKASARPRSEPAHGLTRNVRIAIDVLGRSDVLHTASAGLPAIFRGAEALHTAGTSLPLPTAADSSPRTRSRSSGPGTGTEKSRQLEL